LAANTGRAVDRGANRNREYQHRTVARCVRKLAAQVDDVFVEGVGGWMVPVRSDYFVKDLAVEIGLPCWLRLRIDWVA
jgi:dethiobiotin synthetase